MNLQSEANATEEYSKTFQTLRGNRRRGDPAMRMEFSCVDVEQLRQSGEPEALRAARQMEETAVLEERRRTQHEVISGQIEGAREKAKVEARQEWQAELEELIATERAQMLRAMERFNTEKSRYFAGIEGEVVRLALAIAKRVLHREAMLDPMLLTAAVRVALERLAETSGTALRVPTAETGLWLEVMGAEIEVTSDDSMVLGECVLETKVGRVELGVTSQLEEIERGFFDLLQLRPA